MNRIDLKLIKDELTVTIHGEITNQASLPPFQPLPVQKVLFRFSGNNYVNSAGIRNWVAWMVKARDSYPTAEMVFERVPPNFVKQAASIRDLFVSQAKIKSFIVPYYCEKCHHNSEVILEWGKDIDPNEDKTKLAEKISTHACSQCGALAEIDAVPEHFTRLK